jgi:hypothetical protein
VEQITFCIQKHQNREDWEFSTNDIHDLFAFCYSSYCWLDRAIPGKISRIVGHLDLAKADALRCWIIVPLQSLFQNCGEGNFLGPTPQPLHGFALLQHIRYGAVA